MKRAEWEECLEGFRIVSCAVKSPNVAYVIAVQSEPPKDDENGNPSDELWRVVRWDPLAKEDQNFYVRNFNNLGKDPILAIEGEPYNRLVIADTWSRTFISGIGRDEGAPRMSDMKTLWGKVHIMNSVGLFYRDSQENAWVDVVRYFDIGEVNGSRASFRCFDAFSKDNYYIADFEGCVYFNDDNIWKSIDLRKLGWDGIFIESICCASNGYVYISVYDDKSSKLIKGKNSEWEEIWCNEDSTEPLSLVSYMDFVIASNRTGCFKIVGSDIERFPVPFQVCFTHVNGDLLSASSKDESAIYKNGKWDLIISPTYESDRALVFDYDSVCSRNVSCNDYIIIDDDEFILRYPEFSDSMISYESCMFKVYHGDLVIEGDLSLNSDNFEMVVLGDLIVEGAIVNRDDNFGNFLFVRGVTRCKNMFLGGSFLSLGKVVVDEFIIARHAYGRFDFKEINSPLMIFDGYWNCSGFEDNSDYEFLFHCDGHSDEGVEEKRQFYVDSFAVEFGREEWVEIYEENESYEIDWNKFYEIISGDHNTYLEIIDRLRISRDGREISPDFVIEDANKVYPYSFFKYTEEKDLKLDFQKNGKRLSNELLEVGKELLNEKLSHSYVLDLINRIMSKYDEKAIGFGVSVIVDCDSNRQADVAVIPYVFTVYVSRDLDFCFNTFYSLFLKMYQRDLYFIVDELGPESINKIDSKVFWGVFDFYISDKIKNTDFLSVKNCYWFFEANVGPDVALNLVDVLLKKPGLPEEVYRFFWGAIYKAGRGFDYYQISPGLLEKEIIRGLDLASEMMVEVAKRGVKPFGVASYAWQHLMDFEFPVIVSQWKNNMLTNSDWLQNFDYESDGINVKGEIVNNFRKAANSDNKCTTHG